MSAPNPESSMNTMSESRVDPPPDGRRRILVWDAPVRVFHWMLAISFVGAYLSADSERWRLLHVTLGYTVAGLVAFRLLWGLVGTRHARFASFVRRPAVIRRYLAAMLRGSPPRSTGHNPVGALAILGLLALAVLVAVTGWGTYNEVGVLASDELHEFLANAMLALAGVHVAGVLLGSWLERENLIKSMVTGRKTGPAGKAISGSRAGVAALLLVSILAFWAWQWQAAPTGGAGATATTSGAGEHGHRDDD
jgi:cytochrome b